jgi:transcriptional regulator GlxA family with amidase domain
MHKIAILAMHGVLPFDLATPCEVLSRVRTPSGDLAYDIRVCGEARVVKTTFLDLRVRWDLSEMLDARTIIVPGIADISQRVPAAVIAVIREAAAGGIRIASICTGAFVLAAAGVLDHLRATTHWLAAAQLAASYPAIEVDPNVLYVDNGQLLTSAGAASGIDLCLHLVRRDFGADAAANAARAAVMPLERSGGQAQFILHEPPESSSTLQPLLRWIEEHVTAPLTLPELALKAGTSTRTLSRRFREQTGRTPGQWVIGARVRRAQQLLETTDLPVERIASAVGFDSVSTLRERFHGVVRASPTAYRRAFRVGPAVFEPSA